jgi:phosphatidylinositol-3-phosphatase
MRGRALIDRGRGAERAPRLREGVPIRRVAALLVALLLALLSAAFIVISRSGATAADASPCGTLALSSTNYSHVIWVWMENHSYNEIIGSPEAPYINSLASQCGLASNYHNISHPSLPNYVAATSGLPLAGLTRFTPDCGPSRKCSTSASSVFSQVPSWKAYEESMPKNCDRRNKREYAVRHNPPPYYNTLTECASKDVPYTQLAGDLADGALPAFSFITPNLIDDMHDGSVAQGDAWLHSNLATILSSSEYTSGTVVVIITWDEGEGGTSNDCATNTTDVGCHVATVVVSPSTAPGTQSSTLFNHYSLLGSTEPLLGAPPLGEAATANSMLAAFNL